MDHPRYTVLYRDRLADRDLSQDRRRLDCALGDLRPHQHRRVGLGNVKEGCRLGDAYLYGGDAKHTDALDPSEDRSVDGRTLFADSSSLHADACHGLLDNCSYHLLGEIGLYQFSYRGHVVHCSIASGRRPSGQPLDHDHDYSDRIGSVVFPVPGGLAYARLFHYRWKRIQLPADEPDQSNLWDGLRSRPDRGDSLLEIPRFNAVKPLRPMVQWLRARTVD